MVATDVGIWMALPAVAPAVAVVGVVLFVALRDRRDAEPVEAEDT